MAKGKQGALTFLGATDRLRLLLLHGHSLCEASIGSLAFYHDGSGSMLWFGRSGRGNVGGDGQCEREGRECDLLYSGWR